MDILFEAVLDDLRERPSPDYVRLTFVIWE